MREKKKQELLKSAKKKLSDAQIGSKLILDAAGELTTRMYQHERIMRDHTCLYMEFAKQRRTVMEEIQRLALINRDYEEYARYQKEKLERRLG